MFAALGPFPMPHGNPDAFWSALEDYYLQLMTALDAPRSWPR